MKPLILIVVSTLLLLIANQLSHLSESDLQFLADMVDENKTFTQVRPALVHDKTPRSEAPVYFKTQVLPASLVTAKARQLISRSF